MAGAARGDEICTLRIELCDSDPLIWREVEVPTAITLKGLHDVVQAAMGWQDCHLWEFTISGRKYGLPMDPARGAEPSAEAARTRLRDVLSSPRTAIRYLYDFGDGWEHRLIVSDIRRGEPDVSYPRYVAGSGAAPPEDSGGIGGFYEMLAITADPAHPDHDEISEWLGDHDPTEIDEAEIRRALGRIARRRKAAKARPKKPDG